MATTDDNKAITPRKIVFVHPDLGIGGAERLVIDAAVGLQSLGHKVTILTSHRDKSHCFEPARDGTLDVRVRGDAVFPTTIAGGLSIVLAMLRQLALVFIVTLSSNELKTLDPDVIFVDQLSICIPFFRWLYPKAKVLFYGHFPDRLLASQGEGLAKYAKAVYRAPFDGIEGWSTACADDIVVNSKFTRAVFKGTFEGLRKRELKVIYPCVDTSETQSKASPPLWPDKKVILSINRFEDKKNLGLAIRAYAGLSQQERGKAKLILAGGFDPRNAENATTHHRLQNLTHAVRLTHATFRSNDTLTTDLTTDDVDVLFLLSIPDDLKRRLLHSSSLMVYTPPNEHFGIVPLEAMLAGVPVLATNSGGPLETIYDGRTGFLRSPDSVELWTDVMRKTLIPSSESALREMGQKGKERVLAEFSQTKMVDALDKEIQALCRSTGPRPTMIPDWLYVAFILSGMSVVVCVLMLGLLVWAVNHDKENRANNNGSLTGTVVEVVTSTTSMAGWEELWESAKASKRARGRDEL
ncbi:Alpha-1,3-mannosyltransferase-like protein [Friedmanniomyces endolithicus]|nr:Alpha-1,3-mannosyltransferase-like protein [Friedmanniomyces endolithicus]